MSHAGTLLNISFCFTYQWFCFAEIVPSFNSKAQNWARTVQQEHSYDAARLIYFLRHYVRSDFGMCTVFMNMLHFAVRWESRKQQCPTCHLLQGQRKLGSSLHASVQSAGLVFWTLKNSSVYETQFSTESDKFWAYSIFILSQAGDCEHPAGASWSSTVIPAMICVGSPST